MTTQKSGHLQQNPKNTRKTLKNQHLEQFFKSHKRESRSVVRQRRGFWQSLAFDLGLGLQGAPKDMPICPYAQQRNRKNSINTSHVALHNPLFQTFGRPESAFLDADRWIFIFISFLWAAPHNHGNEFRTTIGFF